jgi:hypothetical protein
MQMVTGRLWLTIQMEDPMMAAMVINSVAAARYHKLRSGRTNKLLCLIAERRKQAMDMRGAK